MWQKYEIGTLSLKPWNEMVTVCLFYITAQLSPITIALPFYLEVMC